MSKNGNKFTNTTGTTGAAANPHISVDSLANRVAVHMSSVIDSKINEMLPEAFEYFDNLSDDEFLKMCATIKKNPATLLKKVPTGMVDEDPTLSAIFSEFTIEQFIDHFDGERKKIFAKATSDIMERLQKISSSKSVSMMERFDAMIADDDEAKSDSSAFSSEQITELNKRFAMFTKSMKSAGTNDEDEDDDDDEGYSTVEKLMFHGITFGGSRED